MDSTAIFISCLKQSPPELRLVFQRLKLSFPPSEHTVDAGGEFRHTIMAHGQLLGEQQQRLAELDSNLLSQMVTAKTAPGGPANQAPGSTF